MSGVSDGWNVDKGRGGKLFEFYGEEPRKCRGAAAVAVSTGGASPTESVTEFLALERFAGFTTACEAYVGNGMPRSESLGAGCSERSTGLTRAHSHKPAVGAPGVSMEEASGKGGSVVGFPAVSSMVTRVRDALFGFVEDAACFEFPSFKEEGEPKVKKKVPSPLLLDPIAPGSPPRPVSALALAAAADDSDSGGFGF
jgi:hypothetical protein